MKAFSQLGEHGLLWQGVAATGAALDERRRGRWLRAWAAIGVAYAVNQLIKFAVRRRRPEVRGLPPLTATMSQLSYPSAHASTSAAAARVLHRCGLVPGAVVYPLAAAMALSRLYLGVHWPSDTVAGMALGAAVGELVQ